MYFVVYLCYTNLRNKVSQYLFFSTPSYPALFLMLKETFPTLSPFHKQTLSLPCLALLPYIRTLRSLLSVLFYQMTWSEFFQKVSIKQRGPFQKKLIARFHFRAATANFWSLLYELAWIFGKSLLNDQYYHFSNSRRLERPSLIIETLK